MKFLFDVRCTKCGAYYIGKTTSLDFTPTYGVNFECKCVNENDQPITLQHHLILSRST